MFAESEANTANGDGISDEWKGKSMIRMLCTKNEVNQLKLVVYKWDVKFRGDSGGMWKRVKLSGIDKFVGHLPYSWSVSLSKQTSKRIILTIPLKHSL